MSFPKDDYASTCASFVILVILLVLLLAVLSVA